MKKILIVCSHFFDDTDANAICVRNLVEEFSKQNEIHIITDEDDEFCEERNNENYLNVRFYFVKCSFYESLLKKDVSWIKHLLLLVFSFFRRFFNLFVFPNVSPVRTKKITKLAKSIISQYGIDYYLATYRPFESIACGEKLKRQFNNVRYISYHLDNLDGYYYKNKLLSKLINKKISRAFKKEAELYCKIFVTFTSNLSSIKSKRIGLPVYKKNERVFFNYSFNDDYINVVYVGTLNIHNRNPEYAFSLFSKYNKIHEKKVLVHLWGNTTSLGEVLKKYNDFVIDNGPINHRYTQYIYENSDFVLNIGNNVTSDMLPSKLFQIFATGKPIISFNKKDDKSLDYLRKYGNSMLLSYENIEYDYKIFEESVVLMRSVKIDWKKDWELFMPEKIAEVLINEK